MKPPKYFNRYRTKAQLLSAVRYAASNELFFNAGNMRFFGRQKFRIIERNIAPMGVPFTDLIPMLAVDFLEKCQRTALYAIDPVTLKLSPFGNVSIIRVSA